MKKEYRKMVRKGNGKIREIKGGQVTIEVPLPITEVLMETTEVVENIGREIRLMVISAITALLRAKSKFRRVRGYKEIPQLLAVLHNKSIDRKEVAA